MLEFPHPATITLKKWPNGAPPQEIADGNYGLEIEEALSARGLVVANGGTLRLYGKDRGATWTHLSATAAASDTTITMASPALNLEAYDEIVIASTDFDQNLAEMRQISPIGSMTFPALSHAHYGVVQNFEPVGYTGTGSWDVDERAEVGLLTRNIKIQGEQGPTSYDYGHVFFCRVVNPIPVGSADVPPNIEISWVEFKNLGVGGAEARYPVHFHDIGTFAGDPPRTLFIENSSVWETFNRGIVMHMTNEVRVENNVVYDVMGHGIYVEDGTVQDCDILNNLSLKNWIPTEPAPAAFVDDKPGNITLRSLNNNVQGNVAGGSEAYGIYLDLYNLPFDPTGMTFANNSAHSCQIIGIYENNEMEPSVLVTFSDSRVWKCREYGMWIRSIRDYVVDGLIAADCRSGFYPASKGLREAGEGHQVLKNGLFVGETANWGPAILTWETNVGRSLPQDEPSLYSGESNAHSLKWDTLNGVEMYDGFIEIENCRFAEFEDLDLGSDPLDYRWAAGLTQVAKTSTWINDPRNRVRLLDFGGHVDRTAYFRIPEVGENQIGFTTIVDEDDSLGWGNGSALMLMPGVDYLASFSSAAFHADSPLAPGLNGYTVPLSAASRGQLAVRLNTNGYLPGVLSQTNWLRVKDPRGIYGTPSTGAEWLADSVPTASSAGGEGSFVFPVLVEVGANGLAEDELKYYRMSYPLLGQQNYPPALSIWLRFTPAIDQVVFLEIPYSVASAPSAVKFFDEFNAQQFATLQGSLAALLNPTLMDKQAWFWESGKLYLKLTSLLKANGPTAELYGTQLRLEILE